jgi:TatA/E family protein of Tat protein translocase
LAQRDESKRLSISCLSSFVGGCYNLIIQPLDTPQGVVAPTPPPQSVVCNTLPGECVGGGYPVYPLNPGVTRMFGLGVAEIVVVCVIGLLLFGNRLPSLARWLGKSFMEFRKEVRGLEEDIRGPVR